MSGVPGTLDGMTVQAVAAQVKALQDMELVLRAANAALAKAKR